MVWVGYILGTLLDPFFSLPVLAVAFFVRDRNAALLWACVVAAGSVVLLALLRQQPPAQLLLISFMIRIALAIGIVFLFAAIRKPSTPAHT